MANRKSAIISRRSLLSSSLNSNSPAYTNRTTVLLMVIVFIFLITELPQACITLLFALRPRNWFVRMVCFLKLNMIGQSIIDKGNYFTIFPQIVLPEYYFLTPQLRRTISGNTNILTCHRIIVAKHKAVFHM